MSWWGKIIGGTVGFMMGGPLGAVLGAAVGHFANDSDAEGNFSIGSRERIQSAFYTATFSVMGHICKADGRVSEDEIALAQQVMDQMDLNDEQRKAAIALFEQGKKPGFQLEDVLLQFNHELGLQLNLKRMFMEIQIMSAYADGVMHPKEKELLLKASSLIGFSNAQYERLEIMIRARFNIGGSGSESGPTVKDAYSFLNLDKSASDSEVKKAYRRLISQHHPDKLVSKGLPEEMMKIAAQRTHEIKQAYETIKKERGMR